jgi:hypothetical protein
VQQTYRFPDCKVLKRLTHSWQIQLLLRCPGSTCASNSAGNVCDVHQQGLAKLPVSAGAQQLGWPQSGHRGLERGIASGIAQVFERIDYRFFIGFG